MVIERKKDFLTKVNIIVHHSVMKTFKLNTIVLERKE